ncbi:hypothetical protein H072_439 [Dactylellina haptotyla CBS 200.50]|uniref:Uncharacterized protein n=1 Tax=Dactylellina haptotyla (strain CBS 200.50) TaxID=1284197 RepID=S8CCZ1_DACHA|nr:hypothetical protein H072_439 [Dactylellina haptotyla CBS 200.50]
MSSFSVKQIYGEVVGKGVGNLMTNFASDPAKLVGILNDSSKNSTLHTVSSEGSINIGLAPSFGTLKANIKELDDALVGIVAISTKEIQKLPPSDRTFEKIRATLLQNAAIEPHGDHYQAYDTFTKASNDAFRFDGSPDSGIVADVLNFFRKLINDSDVLNSLNFDKNVVARMVAESGATVRNFETFFSANEHEEKTVLEVAVLRYPDLDHPYLKLYRVKLKAIRDCKRVLFAENNRNSIQGEVDIQKFKPRQSVWASISQPVRDKARASVVAMIEELEF